MDSSNKIAMLEGRILALSTENSRLKENRPSPNLAPQTPPTYSPAPPMNGGGGSGGLPASAKPSYANHQQRENSVPNSNSSASLPPPLQHNVPPRPPSSTTSRSLPAFTSPTGGENSLGNSYSHLEGGGGTHNRDDANFAGGSLNSNPAGFEPGDSLGGVSDSGRSERQQREQRDMRAALMSQMNEVTRLKDTNRKETECRRNVEQQLQLQKQEMYGLYNQVNTLQNNLEQKHAHHQELQRQNQQAQQQLHSARQEVHMLQQQQQHQQQQQQQSSYVGGSNSSNNSAENSGTTAKDATHSSNGGGVLGGGGGNAKVGGGGKKQQELQTELAKKEAEVTMLKNVLAKKDMELSKLKGEVNDSVTCYVQTDKVDRYATMCQTDPVEALPPLNSRKASPVPSGASSRRSPPSKAADPLDLDDCAVALEKAVTGLNTTKPYILRLFAQAPTSHVHTDPLAFLEKAGAKSSSQHNHNNNNGSINTPGGSFSLGNASVTSLPSNSKRATSFNDSINRTPPQAPVLGSSGGRWCDETAEFDLTGGEEVIPSVTSQPSTPHLLGSRGGSFGGSFIGSPAQGPQATPSGGGRGDRERRGEGGGRGGGNQQRSGDGQTPKNSGRNNNNNSLGSSSRGGSLREDNHNRVEGNKDSSSRRNQSTNNNNSKKSDDRHHSNGNSLNSVKNEGGGGRGDSVRNSLNRGTSNANSLNRTTSNVSEKSGSANRWATGNAANSLRSDGGH